MDGIPAIDFEGSDRCTSWKHDSEPYRKVRPVVNKREVRAALHTVQKRKQSQRMINDLDNVDCIPTNVKSSHQESLYVFEDNAAVIKMVPGTETRFQNP